MNRTFQLVRAETLFASAQASSGLRHLAHIVDPDRHMFRDLLDRTVFYHSLHTAFFPLATGIERLAKLGLMGTELLTEGKVSPVKRRGHRLVALLEELSQATQGLGIGAGSDSAKPGSTAWAEWGRQYVKLLEDYADGNGRYEFLDALPDDRATTPFDPMFEQFLALPHESPADESIVELCSTPSRVDEAVQWGLDQAPERAAEIAASLAEMIEYPYKGIDIWPEALGRTLRYFHLTRWVANTLRETSTMIFYGAASREAGTPLFPDMSDVIATELRFESDLNFVKYGLLPWSDADLVVENLREFYSVVEQHPDWE